MDLTVLLENFIENGRVYAVLFERLSFGEREQVVYVLDLINAVVLAGVEYKNRENLVKKLAQVDWTDENTLPLILWSITPNIVLGVRLLVFYYAYIVKSTVTNENRESLDRIEELMPAAYRDRFFDQNKLEEEGVDARVYFNYVLKKLLHEDVWTVMQNVAMANSSIFGVQMDEWVLRMTTILTEIKWRAQ